MQKNLTPCQEKALKLLKSTSNVFITGVAGSGKSYLVRKFLKEKSSKTFPVLASTGAAAILVGGRTFHSFFGLGIMQGGLEATVTRALSNKKLVRRLKKTEGAVIDEISMLSGLTLQAAETVARLARNSSEPWGGLKICAVGDFAQLPPVNPYGRDKDWAFLNPVWQSSEFKVGLLQTVVRTQDPHFIKILNDVRRGAVSEDVKNFLANRALAVRVDDFERQFDGTRLFPHRETTEKYNLTRLDEIHGKPQIFETLYSGQERYLTELKKSAPIPAQLHLKVQALVMIRQNDPQGRYFNGSLGLIETLSKNFLRIRLFDGPLVEIEKAVFSVLNADGIEVASAENFPINLAYAATIHKAQGLTLDKVLVSLKGLWEPGQAYVAMSRVRTSEGLFISDWSPSSIMSDPQVARFNLDMMKPSYFREDPFPSLPDSETISL